MYHAISIMARRQQRSGIRAELGQHQTGVDLWASERDEKIECQEAAQLTGSGLILQGQGTFDSDSDSFISNRLSRLTGTCLWAWHAPRLMRNTGSTMQQEHQQQHHHQQYRSSFGIP